MRSPPIALLVFVACSSGKPPSKVSSDRDASVATATAPRWTMDDLDKVSGELEIVLSEPTESIGGLANRKARPTATIKSVKLEAAVSEKDDLRPLTPAELARVVLREPQIRLRSLTDAVITHAAPNGQHFTVRDLLAAIEETERQTRGQTDWSGGIDVHHVFFEGIERGADGVWTIHWGS